MHGILTEQLPEDGTSGDLLLQIQNIKEQILSERKVKRESNENNEITEFPFTLPKSWRWIRLCDLGSFSGGKTPSMNNSENWKEGTIPWITSKDMKQKYLYSSEMMVSKRGAQELTIYPPNTVLFVVRSGILRRLFPVAILKTNGTINQDLKALTLYLPDMCEYIYYVLKGFEPTILYKYTKDGTTVNNIIFDDLLSMPIPLPPYAEQRRIVEKIEQAFSILDTIDELQSQYADNLSALKSKLIDSAIQGKLTEQLPEDGTAEELYQQIQEEKQALIKAGKIKKEKPLPEIKDEDMPFEIPRNWKWFRFATISIIIRTGLIRSRGEQYDKAEYYYFKMNNIGNFDGKCHFENMEMVNASIEEYDRYVLEKGDFLFNTRNSKELVGKAATVPEITQKILFNNNILKVRFGEGVLSEYITYYFISSQGRSLLSRLSTSTTNVAAIYQRQLEVIPIPLPPLAEQKRIVEKLDEVLSCLG